jgi:NAD-dependent dihydropyrimidine dehydrogenase PreA subunit
MSSQKVYEDFMGWLARTWYGLPESKDLLDTIKTRYSQEDAAILTGVPPFPDFNTIDEIATHKGVDASELAQQLDRLAVKGLIHKEHFGENTFYALDDLFFATFRTPFWAGKDDDYTKDVASTVNSFAYSGGLDPFAKDHTKPLRALPIHQTIKDTKEIRPYEDVLKALDKVEYYSVSKCSCRHRKNIDPDYEGSKMPMEVCLHFDNLGRYIVENGMGREITREETEAILKKAADAGLVHGISNWEDKPDTLCNCDKECCIQFEAYHKLGHLKSVDASNYMVRVAQESCKGCGLCVKRCPMDALSLKDYPQADKTVNKKAKVAELDPELCLGCGVCVHRCPTQSLTLELKEKIVAPPRDPMEWMGRHFADLNR